jgi:NAD(P)-dependent dehydrogenase (short-subunit alcohol dehydrogenase family)
MPIKKGPAAGQESETDFAARARAAADLLESIVADRGLLAALPTADRRRIVAAAGSVFNPDVHARRRMVKATIRARKMERIRREDERLATTGIRSLRRRAVYTTADPPPPPSSDLAREGSPEGDVERTSQLFDGQNCYICKQDYSDIHHFYDQLCPECADLNFRKRTELADLGGRVALLTGGRVKIGYQAGLKLLRSGARLIVTTRFPRDSARRYAQEPDFEEWSARLEIFGLDLRHTPSVEAFCDYLDATHERLDYNINNACQTVRRPPAFYEHMMAAETAALAALPAGVRRVLGAYEGVRSADIVDGPGSTFAAAALDVRMSAAAGLTRAAELSQVALLSEETQLTRELFPAGRFDQDLQQVDLRSRNSWRLLLAEVPAIELLEVHLVNAIAPFIINARLKPLLLRTPGRAKHVVNVSAVEGQFYRRFKTTRHPHTNMAKAALNMMTRTSATDYHADGIHMNSIDTGWVTDEDPVEIAARKAADHRFHPPLDIVDGAARIVDPVITGVNTGKHVWGQFLKDYRSVPW